MNENKSTFTVVETPATKVSVTIFRQQLWRNFVETWAEIAWEDCRGVDLLQETADILCGRESLQVVKDKIRKLFRDGSTVLLMGDAMLKLDVVQNDNLLREIIVVDKAGHGETVEMIVIHHEDINF